MSASLRASTGAPAAERGSAYLFVLLVLLVLTVIGLSLVVITQTEAQIGGAEKTAVRVLMNAESGLRIQFALSRFAATRPRDFALGTTRVGTTDITSPTDVSAFYPTLKANCNLCSVNKGGDEYWAMDYLTNAQGRRVGTAGSVTVPQASKLLSQFYLVQPEKDVRVDESIRVYDPSVAVDDPNIPGLEVLVY